MRWIFCFIALTPGLAMGDLVTFDDLSNPPGDQHGERLVDANGGSGIYHGITWSSGFSVFGSQYSVPGIDSHGNSIPPFYGNVFGTYGLTNSNGTGTIGDQSGDNIADLTITTDQVLMGSWWGTNEYYGYGGGTNEIQIEAIATSGTLTVDVQLPPWGNDPNNVTAFTGSQIASPLQFVDTSIFATLTGIKEYHIIVPHPTEFNNNWVADDFTFAAAVPEPSSLCLLGLGLAAVVGNRVIRRRAMSVQSAV